MKTFRLPLPNDLTCTVYGPEDGRVAEIQKALTDWRRLHFGPHRPSPPDEYIGTVKIDKETLWLVFWIPAVDKKRYLKGQLKTSLHCLLYSASMVVYRGRCSHPMDPLGQAVIEAVANNVPPLIAALVKEEETCDETTEFG